MKPIKLEMEHFGPFKIETIDFSSVEGQMFLISGKTGSGKTMIFDAITFGLYGQTSTKDRDEDSVRSQFATDDDVSRVSLEFKVGGQKYKVERELSFSKAGRKSKVPSKAALYAEDGTVIESSVTGVTNKIIELIQLNAEQFRQILILPQGEFKRLLVSTSEEKQKILRTLFRTERFVHFELKLRDLERNMQTEMQHLEAKISEQMSTLPDSEEHPSFHRRLASLEKKIAGTRQESAGLEGKIRTARTKRNTLQEELNKKIGHNEKVAKLQELAGQQKRLEDRAGSIRLMEEEIADHKRVAAISFELKREQELESQLMKSGEKLEKLNSDHDKIKDEYAALHEELSVLRSNEAAINESERFITRNERFLDARFEVLPKRIVRLNDELEQIRRSCRKLNDEYTSLGETLETLAVSHEDIETLTLRKHALELEQQKLKRALEQEKKYMEYDSEINAIKEKLRINENNRHECEQSLESVKSTVQSKFRKEDREHIEHLISHLEVGGPCPVCQKTVDEMPDAPYYMSEAEEEHISTLNARLENLKGENESLRHEEKLYVKLLQDAERLAHETLTEELEAIKASVTETDGALKDLKSRLERRETIQAERDEKSNLLHKGNIEIEKTANRLGQSEEQLKDFRSETGFVDYNEFKSHIENSKREAEEYRQRKESLEARRDVMNKDLTMLSQSIRHLEETMDRDEETIKGMTAVVDDFLNNEPFIDRAELHQILSQPGMEAKEQEVRDFHREKSSTETQIDSIKKELAHGEAYDLEDDRALIGQADDELERLQTELAVLQSDIRQYDRVFETVSAYIGDYETKKERYQAVHELFQKVTGNNHSKISLERYVLTYFLEKILNIANSRLLEMTNHRYALIRSRAASRRKTGLDIEVFDYYNNSARHISSLSGGETFQASLSLALALSEAVQQEAGGIHLDTMFIDEGFGTLDKETLEIAISTLIDLQSGGKTIGIISHVTELKERLHHILEVKSEDEISTATFNI